MDRRELTSPAAAALCADLLYCTEGMDRRELTSLHEARFSITGIQ